MSLPNQFIHMAIIIIRKVKIKRYHLPGLQEMLVLELRGKDGAKSLAGKFEFDD